MKRVPMKQTERWAHVSNETGFLTYLCGPAANRTRAKAIMNRGERLARVLITEIEPKRKPRKGK